MSHRYFHMEEVGFEMLLPMKSYGPNTWIAL